MAINKKAQMQMRYEGFLDTPMLFDSLFNGLSPLLLPFKTKNNLFKNFDVKESRLGKLIEYFVINELNGVKNISVLKTNIQINNNKITIGEIDTLIKQVTQLIHLEIVFKFYLYENNSNSKEIDNWIGPNRNDSLSEKIEKLKSKQLPLLFNKITYLHLKELGFDINQIIQKIYFKAHLFVPFELVKHSFKYVNNSCIEGYYISYKELNKLSPGMKFYIPKKLDWIVKPHNSVKWLSHSQMQKELYLHQKKRLLPYVGLKKENIYIKYLLFFGSELFKLTKKNKAELQTHNYYWDN